MASVTSATNDKDDYEMIPGAWHRSPGICLTAEENPGKPKLEDRLMKRLPSPQMGCLTSKSSQYDRTASQEERRKEEGKDGKGD